MTKPLFLIIDDERNFSEFLKEALEGEGYEVALAGTARAGLELARKSLPRVVLLDQNLPDQQGLALLPEFQRLASVPVVIVITAHAEVGYAVTALKAGAFHYLPKPFAFDDLLAVLAQAAITNDLLSPTSSNAAMQSIIGTSAAVHELRRQLVRIAASPVPAVLLEGESGTGKELAARAIHDASARRSAPFVAVNCAALSETLLMSELFGHERGSFTDARQQKKGVFELAHGGTLLLDEVSEMGVRAQAALLRALEQRSFTRVGGQSEIKVDVRVIAASNRDMRQLVSTGQFRIDLYHRLNVVRVMLPSLRERTVDIPLIAEHLSRSIALSYGESVRPVTPAAVAALEGYEWPGNIRELRNVIERAYVISGGPQVELRDLPDELHPVPAAIQTGDVAVRSAESGRFQDAKREVVEHFERGYLLEALRKAGGNVTSAAERAGVLRQVFQRMLLRHGITPTDFRDSTSTRVRHPE
ncbi:sigma-54-dependent transcriptional regulator [Gemmatimonas sp.]|uniref:sigma-54-dependent transcriptional regulator n=1 Tax=Gemmatimonas sp. TaxID=1962908 RepID=UPI00391F1A8E